MNADTQRNIKMRLGEAIHEGILAVPPQPQGLVLFAHGSGSSRHSSRNHFVARQLREVGLATLLVDLLSESEDEVYETRFDIDLLADRLVQASAWVAEQPELAELPQGYFGASTGAAAALKAAAQLPGTIRAVVSRGGRPDLAGEALPRVDAPTPLIVGGADTQVIELNQQARARMQGNTELVIVPGATHLFEEPGTLYQASQLAAEWFVRWLRPE
ncbi:MAG: dienelactone hydrolase family protein [Guyparkeria sp.]